MNRTGQRAFRWLVLRYDDLWRRLHRVRRIDPLLSLSVEVHRGNRYRPPAGIRLDSGCRIGILHLNHGCFVDTAAGGHANVRGALRFRRALMHSLQQLARRSETEPELACIEAYYGVTWFRPHGERLGFVIERLPGGVLTRMRSLHFRMLLRAFFPALAARERGRLHPYAFWLTRQALLTHFLASPRGGVPPRAETR